MLQQVINDFIDKSKSLNKLDSPCWTGLPMINDAVLQASKWHEILYESPEIRVLWSVTKPREHEPFHMHYWKRLMVIVQGAHFEIEYADGAKEQGNWPIGVYELPSDTQSAAYINSGDTEFMALSFEIKK